MKIEVLLLKLAHDYIPYFSLIALPTPPRTSLSSLSPAGAPQARVPSVAVPRGGADPDGLHDVGRLEV